MLYLCFAKDANRQNRKLFCDFRFFFYLCPQIAPFLSKQSMIMTLAGTQPNPQKVVDRQSCNDIIHRMLVKHKKCERDYDRICEEFDLGTNMDVCVKLFEFCKRNFLYVIEDEEEQYVSSPYTMLTNGRVDCKNYALFCAGVIDALKRRGRRVHWCFRYANYDLIDSLLHPLDVGHVFVVVDPNGENIWLDPVMNEFNYKMWYWKKRDKVPRSYASIGRLPMRVGDAEGDLLSAVKQYSDGLSNAMSVTTATQTLNAISAGVLKSISASIPGLSQALAAVNAGQVALNNAFGPGSLAARLFSDISSNIIMMPISLVNTIFNGRTYNTDQYWAAQYYKYYVLGQSNVTGINDVADSDVLPALKWFIDRLGVFISGREHIIALTKSPQAYMDYFSVNADTTTDPVRVDAAYNVASQYFNFNGGPGSWANTVGVYDAQVVDIANATGESVEQVAASQGYQGVYSSTAQGAAGQVNWMLVAAAAVLVYVGLSK
jgi:hypothetical protein